MASIERIIDLICLRNSTCNVAYLRLDIRDLTD